MKISFTDLSSSANAVASDTVVYSIVKAVNLAERVNNKLDDHMTI